MHFQHVKIDLIFHREREIREGLCCNSQVAEMLKIERSAPDKCLSCQDFDEFHAEKNRHYINEVLC